MSKPRHIIVTAANDLYFPLLLSLLQSLRGLSFCVKFDIGVLDVGLSDESKKQIAAFDAMIVPARVDINYPDRLAWEQQSPAMRAQTARPYLRDYFTGYDSYMWMDADAWAQTADAIDVMLDAAANDDAIYIASEIDRDYAPYFLSSQPWNYHFKWYSANFPADMVNAIFPRPMLNNGVWAMGATSPVWDAWGDVYTACLQRVETMTREQFMCDQLSLNMAIYTRGLPLKIMPAEFNWLSLYAMPVWDVGAKMFVRPTVPRGNLSIIHLTHEKKLREIDFVTTDGGVLRRTLLNEVT